MTHRSRPVHSLFESLRAAMLSRRGHGSGRPACFATNEQLSALGLARLGNSGGHRPARGFDTPFEAR